MVIYAYSDSSSDYSTGYNRQYSSSNHTDTTSERSDVSSTIFHGEGFHDQLDSGRYKEKYQWQRYEDEWISTNTRIDSIADHVTGGWNDYDYGLLESRESDWISTSNDFYWLIWEITRRLTKLKRSKVELHLIRKLEYTSRYYKGNKPIIVDPLQKIREKIQDDIYHWFDHSKLDAAKKFAYTSGEILFYGRIFRKDILETSVWTRREPGFDLPDYCFIPRKYWSYRDSWMDRLVFSAGDDSAKEARQKLINRRPQLQNSRR
ncbi:uncharacterized protein L201_003489 [Kwoniella dendrophila CBS 6074]|uniref:Uncharacterized protein n=1 Tax=Kwoniella dendrophila CBS 6074 TaxID=1295534 RepID=A0AAX4JT33_9TREE